jgi:hypothetical protein
MKIDRCCNCHCPYGTKEYPCWGHVAVVDEIETEDGLWEWIHTCEGHANFPSGGEYVKSEDNDDRSTLRDNDEDID